MQDGDHTGATDAIVDTTRVYCNTSRVGRTGRGEMTRECSSCTCFTVGEIAEPETVLCGVVYDVA